MPDADSVSLADIVAARLRAEHIEFNALQVEPGRIDDVFHKLTTQAHAA